MTSLSVPHSGPSPLDRRGTASAAALLALVIAADWLFYEQQVGISAALFLACVGAGVVAVNPVRTESRATLAAASLLAAALVPLCLEFSAVALLLGVLGLAVFAVLAIRPAAHWIFALREALLLLFSGAWRATADIFRFGHAAIYGERVSGYRTALTSWIVPVALGALFLLLFSAANPLIEDWLALLNPMRALTQLSAERILFWLVVLSLTWPFITISREHILRPPTQAEIEARLDRPWNDAPPRLLNNAAILRSLIMFNALFAVQTALDATYLWGGAELPAGMSYAAYAHRGAYPLVIAALLAAAFVLIAMRPGSDSERSPLVRTLVYLWTAQTLLLVVSSILRLDLYVEAYSLTRWRVAAFVWMALIAIGLILIAARIAFRRSNLWLVTGNTIALTVAIYVCSIANLPSLIAHYNVAHSRDLSGQGVWLDLNYISGLGPQAIPALDAYLARAGVQTDRVKALRNTLAIRHWRRNEWREPGWRAWAWWNWRLSQYLRDSAKNPSVP